MQGGVAPGQVSMAGAGLPVKQEALALRGVDALLFSIVPTPPYDSPPGTCTPHIPVCVPRACEFMALPSIIVGSCGLELDVRG